MKVFIFLTSIISIVQITIKNIQLGTDKKIGKIIRIIQIIIKQIPNNFLINKGSLIFSLKNLNKWYSIKNTSIKVMKI